jgi:hypothetical protein
MDYFTARPRSPSKLQKELYATAKLLSQLHGNSQQCPVSRQSEEHHSEYHGPSSGMTISPRHVHPPPSKFLDRLAKIFACCTEDKGSNVCATAFTRTHDGKPKIYLAKNNEFKCEFSIRDEQLAARLQMWMLSIALRAEDETWNGDPLLTQIIKDNSKAIDGHIEFIRDLKPQELEDLCGHPQFVEEAQHLGNLCSVLSHRNTQARYPLHNSGVCRKPA